MWQEKFVDLLNKRSTQLLLTGVITSATGLTAGYMIAAKRLEEKYKTLADEEIKSVKERYSILTKKGEYADLNALASKYEDTLKEVGYLPLDFDAESPTDEKAASSEGVREPELEDETEDDSDESEESEDKFQSDDPETYFDWNEENNRRITKPLDPYVITFEEFNNCERDYQQTTITYYDGDDVLADEREQPIADIANTVGYENLLRFGHGSGDPNVVYIRNERIQLEFELIKHGGKYAEIVFGIIEHSDKSRLRKFREYD